MREFVVSKQGIIVLMTGGLVIFVLAIWLNFGQTRPKAPTNPELVLPAQLPNTNISTTSAKPVTFQDIQIKTELPSTPPEMLVFIRSGGTITEQGAVELGKSFGFDQGVEFLEAARLYVWKNDGGSLSLNQNNGAIIYSKRSTSVGNFTTNNEEVAKSVASDFLKNIGMNLSEYKTRVDYLSVGSGEASLAKDYSQANMAVVSLKPNLNGYGLYGQNGIAADSAVWVGSDSQVYKTSLNLDRYVSSQKTLPVISVAQVVGVLSRGGARVVSIDGAGFDTKERNSFVRLEIQSIELGYFTDQKSTIIQPIYIIAGRGFEVNDRQGVDLVIYVEAIKK